MTITMQAVWIIAAGWTVTEWFRAWRYGTDIEVLTDNLINRAGFCATLQVAAWVWA